MQPLLQYSPLTLHLSPATRILSESPAIFFIEHHPRFQLVKTLAKHFLSSKHTNLPLKMSVKFCDEIDKYDVE